MKLKKCLIVLVSLFLSLSILTSIMSTSVKALTILYWPVPGHHTLSQGYHDGHAIDISDGSIYGATVIAAMGGTVDRVYYCSEKHEGLGDCNGFGTGIVIIGNDNRAYQYAHMVPGSIPANLVKGATVQAGQAIGKVGDTGWSGGTHLHFGISNTINYNDPGPDPSDQFYYADNTNNCPPIGLVECEIVNNNQLFMRGWAFDPDEPSKSITVHVYVNGTFVYEIKANGNGDDVNEHYGITGKHRFKDTIDLYAYGTLKINFYAIDSQRGGNSPLGEKVNNPKDYMVSSTKPTLTYATIDAIADQNYTGSAICPDFVVRYGYRTLRKDDHFTVTYSNNVNPGTATVTINGTGEYTGSYSTTFKIVQTAQSHTLSLAPYENGAVTLSKTTANAGEEITVTATPITGYVLDAIKVNGTAISDNKFTMPDKDTTVAVTFKKAAYSISVNKTGNGTVDLSKKSANYGDEITVTATPAEGYELTSIKVNDLALSGNKFNMPAQNTTVDVVFTEIAMPHTLTKIEAKKATCTEPGNTEYYLCEDTSCGCGKAYSDKFGQHEIYIKDTVVPAAGHTLEKVAAKEAKCTEKGHLAHWKCTKCEKLFKDSEGKLEITAENIEVDALGHDKDNLKHVQAKKETYKEDGNIEHYICPRCGKKFADPDCKKELTEAEIVIPKKGAAELDETAVVDGLKYKVTNPSTDGTGTVTLTGVDEKKASVVIPGTVEIKESTYIVDRIAAKAFYKDLTLKTVVIGANIRFIDSCAFYGCKNLVKVSGGGKVETIAASVFAYCSKLKTFVITSPALRLIGSGAFNKDKKLKTIYIKNTVKLTKAGVKKSLKGSSVKKVKVKKSKVKAYKKIFKKKNSGRSVKVKK